MVDQEEIHRMVQSKDEEELRRAVNELYSNFTVLPDKGQAWGDLHRLIYDENELVRLEAGYALSGVFSHVPDKEQAWDDLIWLTANDVNINVGWYISDVLGSVFPYVPNKKQAQDDLHRLTQAQSEYDEDVRLAAGCALGSVFPHVPDKKQAWKDLILLTSDESSDVRAFANYSLGRASIFKATESLTDDNFRKELENALEFFEKSAKEEGFFKVFSNPASFCLPFYRSFYAITFKKEKVEDEVQKYFAEAKSAVKGSNSKEKLLEVVENLANALKEAQNAKNLDDRTSNLNSCRRYIERAAELLDANEEKAPGATKLIRKGLPIIDERVQEIIVEIQEKAKIACQQSKGTPTEEIACAANQEIQKWQISDQEQMTRGVENLIFSLKSKIPFTPENKNIHDKIEEIKKETDLTKQYEMLPMLIALIPTATVHTVHIGDNVTSDINTSGKNSQVVIKGDPEQNIDENIQFSERLIKKTSWIDRINSPATIAAFIFGLTIEIGTYIYPIPYSHYISVGIALFVFTIVTILNKG